jgi:flagellar biosynthesis protein FlhF
MRLRSFTGRTMSEAMGCVRQQLGPEAIIVSTAEDDDGVMRVTAALDTDLALPMASAAADGAIDVLGAALAAHGVAPDLAERIVTTALPFDAETPLVALSSALASLYPFKPVAAEDKPRRILLCGPPGAGKTMTAAKLAARAVIAGGKVRLVSADAARAGASGQLAAFATILGVPLHCAADSAALERASRAADPAELLLIDTAGINPYSDEDRGELDRLIAAGVAEPVLVLPAGGDTVDTVEMARVFAEHGCSRLVVTRLDVARRLGSIVAAAEATRLAFAEAGLSPAVADGLTSFNPVLLARLLLQETARARRPLRENRGNP